MSEKASTCLTLKKLLARWKESVTLENIDSLVREGKLTAYDKQNVIDEYSGHHVTRRGKRRPSQFGINGASNHSGQDDIFFELDEIQELNEYIVSLTIEPSMENNLEKQNKNNSSTQNKIPDEKISTEDTQQQSDAGKGLSPANADRWERSVEAALELWVTIFTGSKKDWIREDFTNALAKAYSEYHTIVRDLAWQKLPDEFKHGPGRPKNPKNIQQSNK